MLKPFKYGKFNLQDARSFGILWKRDVINFNKRLRYFINQYNLKNGRQDTPYRYVFTGEYGPKRFRPHYHAVLFFDDEKIITVLSSLVAKAWKYGRIDCQLSKDGECAQYVAGYVAGNSCIAKILTLSWSKPFALHSVRFGQSPDEKDFEKYESLNYGTIGRRVFDFGGKLREVAPSLSLQSALFPKCYRFSVSDDILNIKRYTLLSYLSQQFARPENGSLDFCSASEMCRYVLRNVDWFQDDIIYGMSLDELFPFTSDPESCLHTAFYVSKKFLELCARYGVTSDSYYKTIKNYYADKDYDLLRRSLESMEHDTYMGLPPEFLITRYGNLPNILQNGFFASDTKEDNRPYWNAFYRFSESVDVDMDTILVYHMHPDMNPLYSHEYMQNSMWNSMSIKHKKQNEENMLLYDY